MARSLKPKSVLKTLAKSLHMKGEAGREALACTLAEMPGLISGDRLEAVIASAAAGAQEDAASADDGGEGGDEGPAAVAKLLRETLSERLREVQPAFVQAAEALRTALELPVAKPAEAAEAAEATKPAAAVDVCDAIAEISVK